MSDMQTAPQTAQELRTVILERYDSLSSRLQQIARYVLDEPNELALETLAVIADRSGVQPSAIVRFAKSFGFDGASQMQRLFRDGLLSGHTGLG
ncbi:MAG: MurR/RpiR family transcriptional regulator, partial [Rhodospirillaceae bacterium]|nr:MurR/RpiR family transcriptional regulator [Rhodospirillaceae bacterium]